MAVGDIDDPNNLYFPMNKTMSVNQFKEMNMSRSLSCCPTGQILMLDSRLDKGPAYRLLCVWKAWICEATGSFLQVSQRPHMANKNMVKDLDIGARAVSQVDMVSTAAIQAFFPASQRVIPTVVARW